MRALPSNTDFVDLNAVEVITPGRQTLPFVYASPHSGRAYPHAFIEQSRLDPLALRRSEDFLVDQLLKTIPTIGAPLVKALFPRSYCDPNREPYELDPAMFAEDLPSYVNSTSQRLANGLGTIPRIVGAGQDIYKEKLLFSEAERRISQCYRPYHRAVTDLLDSTVANFGFVVLIDCHSMPSIGGPRDLDQGVIRPDVVLGDRFGSACDPAVTAAAEQIFQDLGYRVVRNAPYAGGFITQHYGRPTASRHALQIEINRGLYMDERKLEIHTGFTSLAPDLHQFALAMAEITPLLAAYAA